MTRYLIRRVLQAIPVLFFISVDRLWSDHISPVDPMSIYEDNPDITPEDMAMLEYRLGLRQPAFLNFRGQLGHDHRRIRWSSTTKSSASGGTEPSQDRRTDPGHRGGRRGWRQD